MQFPGQGKPPVGIIFDSDLDSIDDALALALLYGFDGKNEARVVSVSVSTPNLNAAAFCDAVGRFYAGAVNSGFGFGFGRTLPLGLATASKMAEDAPMLTVPLSKQNADGKPVYDHGIHKLNDTAEVAALIRNAFTAQYDQNAIVVLALFKLGIGGTGLSALAGALFIAPYILLSATAGKMADRFAKPRVIVWYKLAEVSLMIVAALAFLTASVIGLLVVLAGLGVQATLFGPVKYGLLPEQLADDELVAGNGLIEASTFLSIVIGTVAGGALIQLFLAGICKRARCRLRLSVGWALFLAAVAMFTPLMWSKGGWIYGCWLLWPGCYLAATARHELV